MRFKRNCKVCSKSFRPSGKNVVVCNVCNPYRKGRGIEMIKKKGRLFFK